MNLPFILLNRLKFNMEKYVWSNFSQQSTVLIDLELESYQKIDSYVWLILLYFWNELFLIIINTIV